MTPPADDSTRLHLRADTTRQGPFDVVVTPESAGWGYSSLRVVDLAPGESVDLATGDAEVMVVPLHGSVEVETDGVRYALAGRRSVFDGPTDVLYVPQGSTTRLASASGARVAVPGARVPAAASRLSVRHVPAAEIAVELRGAGSCSRQVHGFAAADAFNAHALIAVEVITPGGNWSSYPPHKHDEESAHESELEEIYYYEIASGPDGQAGVGYHRTYGTAQRPLQVLTEVRSRDTVLVPHGWHGPCAATPGYDMYYLNVMAGPSADRAWRILDDPDLAWVRGSWASQAVDPRLPITHFAQEHRGSGGQP